MDNVIINKTANIERCLQRVREVYGGSRSSLDDLTKQDSIILNIQRGCESAIDLAMHLVSREKLGIPQSSREAFEIFFCKIIIVVVFVVIIILIIVSDTTSKQIPFGFKTDQFRPYLKGEIISSFANPV